jgi:hypothetical protein
MGTKKRGEVDPRLLKVIAQVTGKRPKTVLAHILKHGFITTEDLGDYGYNHPPRAARDVREAGVPLVTFRVRGRDGRSIAAYRLGSPDAIQGGRLGGRSVLSKELLDSLYEAGNGRCYSCFHRFEKRYLTIDHRIPYEISGEVDSLKDIKHFMLLCGSCQRRKSWSCEHCPNWSLKSEEACAGCYWASPEDYEHVATAKIRRVEIVFSGAELEALREIEEAATAMGVGLADVLKQRIARP